MKPTKRKAFNFLRSYFDVLNELKTDSDKLNFLTSIINKQFLNEEPKKLNFIVNLCYESQRHQIESSVKGWERASNEALGTTPPTTLGTTPPTTTKEEEEKGEEEEEEEVKEKTIISYLNEKSGKKYNHKTKETKDKIKARLNDGYTINDFKRVIDIKVSEWLETDMEQYLRPITLFSNKFDSYLNQELRIVVNKTSITERIDKYHNLNQDEKQKLQRDILKIPVIERTQREQYVATEKL